MAHTHASSRTTLGRVGHFEECADRVWVSRRVDWDLNVTVVAGDTGVLVVDTTATAAQATEVLTEIRALGRGEVVAVVNTHAHFDHTYGNRTFRQAYPGVPVHAHERAAAELLEQPGRLAGGEEGDLGQWREELLALEPLAPDRLLSSAAVVDLGGRRVELVHPGRGHTAGDLVALVPDADVAVLGDLVERQPAWGTDCWPLEWPGTLDLVADLLGPDTVVVPGHGPLEPAGFVREQQELHARVAQQVADLAASGVPVGEAPARGRWPVEAARLGHAVARGYAQLPRGSRRLPLA